MFFIQRVKPGGHHMPAVAYVGHLPLLLALLVLCIE
jgi:hypothetical protein